MISIDTAIEIDAPPAEVWAVLVDTDAYPDWNPHFPEIDGELEPDAELVLHVEREGAEPRGLDATVTGFESERRLEWTATILSRWLFRGRHFFELEPVDGDRTRFHNRERIVGVAAPVAMRGDIERDYEAMNEALKRRVEAGR